MNGLLKDTLAELLDKKGIYLFLVITLISMLLLVSSGSLSMSVNGENQAIGLNELVPDFGKQLLNATQVLMSLLIFLSVIMSAGVIPNMFIKGRADYFLSKPISRNSLLLNKFLSVWLVFGSLIVGCGLATYLVGSTVHSVYSNQIFTLLGFTFIEFFVWLAISFFIGITTGKTVTTITTIFLLWVSQMILSQLHASQLLFEQFGFKNLGKFTDYLYYLIPKTSELSDLFENALTNMASLNSYVFYSTVGFSVSVLFFTLILFKRKNY